MRKSILLSMLSLTFAFFLLSNASTLPAKNYYQPLPPDPPTKEGFTFHGYEFINIFPQAASGTQYSHGNPTAQEQQMLEYINQARANPPAEGIRLADTTDPDVLYSMTYWGVNKSQLKADFAGYPVRPPIAFNQYLIQAARNHSQDMATNQYQGHTGTDGSDPGTRMTNAGYNFSGSWSYGENVYAYSKSIFFGHAGFNIDWGVSTLGHRKNIMQYDKDTSQFFREIGVGIVNGSGAMGPLVVTENFTYSGNTFFLLGVVYQDKNSNSFYDIDEGLSGVTITTSQGSYYAVTSTSGGYAIPLIGTTGSLQVTASGNGVSETKSVSLSGTNVKVDFKGGGGVVSNVKLVISCDINGDKKKDIIKTDTNGQIQYTTDLHNWVGILGTLTGNVACGDLDGNGNDDIIGMNSQGAIWHTLNKGSSWQNIQGALSKIFIADMNGDGKDDVLGLNDKDNIYITNNLRDWSNIPGSLAEIKPGNFSSSRNGNEFAGINSSGYIYYTTDMNKWTNVPGVLSKLFTGEINGDGRSDLLGLNSNKNIYYSTDLANLTKILGTLDYITTGDLNGDGINDIVGYNTNGAIYYTTSLTNPNWINIPGALTTLITGDFDGNGRDDIAGIGTDGKIYITTDLKTWNSIN